MFVSKFSDGREIVYSKKPEYVDAHRFANRLLSELSATRVGVDGFVENVDSSLVDWYGRVDECLVDLVSVLRECPGLIRDNYTRKDF